MVTTSAVSRRSHETTVAGLPVMMPTYRRGLIQQDQGIPFGTDPVTDELDGFDIINLRQEKRIDSTVIGVFGKKGHGKTTLFITLAYRALKRKANGQRRTKVYIDDLRPEDGRPEYHRLRKVCGTKHAVTVSLINFGLNLLDMLVGLTFNQQLHMVRGLIEIASRRRLSAIQARALSYGLKRAIADRGDAALTGDLLLGVRTLSAADAKAYALEALQHQLAKRGMQDSITLDTTDPELKKELQRHMRRLLKAAQQVGDILENLLEGEFGGLFGGKHSLAEVMQKSLVVWDYNGLNTEMITLVKFMLNEIQAAAIQRHDHRFYADWEFHDENYSMWKILPYAESMSNLIKRIRGTGIVIVLASHRPEDYNSVGKKGSPERNQALNMLSDIDVWFIGQVGQQTAANLKKRLLLSDIMTDLIQQSPVGHWVIKIGKEEPYIRALEITPIERLLSESDGATTSKAII